MYRSTSRLPSPCVPEYEVSLGTVLLCVYRGTRVLDFSLCTGVRGSPMYLGTGVSPRRGSRGGPQSGPQTTPHRAEVARRPLGGRTGALRPRGRVTPFPEELLPPVESHSRDAIPGGILASRCVTLFHLIILPPWGLTMTPRKVFNISASGDIFGATRDHQPQRGGDNLPRPTPNTSPKHHHQSGSFPENDPHPLPHPPPPHPTPECLNPGVGGWAKQAVGGGGGPLNLSQNGNKVRAPQHTRV